MHLFNSHSIKNKTTHCHSFTELGEEHVLKQTRFGKRWVGPLITYNSLLINLDHFITSMDLLRSISRRL